MYAGFTFLCKYHSFGQFLKAFELYIVKGLPTMIDTTPTKAIAPSLIIPGRKNPDALPCILAINRAIKDPINP